MEAEEEPTPPEKATGGGAVKQLNLFRFQGNYLILSCSSQKKEHPTERAIDLYEGQAFRMVRQFMKENPGISIHVDVLSAKYGFIDALEEIEDDPWEPYDLLMDPARAAGWRSVIDECIEKKYYLEGNTFFYGSELYYSALPFDVPHSHGPIGMQLHQLREWLESLKEALR